MRTLTFAITGSGGSGVVSLGEMLLCAAAKIGYFGLMRKSFGPQIRGGESAAIIRLGTQPITNFTAEIQVLFALDWHNFLRFQDEIPISEATLVIADTQAGVAPSSIASIVTLDLTGAANTVGGARANSVLLGMLGAWLGCSADVLSEVIHERLVKLDSSALAQAVMAMEQGIQQWEQRPAVLTRLATLPPERDTSVEPVPRWLASGNQLAGLGALETGVKFVAAYPITPASDCLEWMAQHMESVQGQLVQAEDELAAINMVIGAAYGGVPAMTATSGPGLSLMTEAMGLAVASETPVVVLNVMRGGPSTGIPTKSEQSDLNIALYGLHGDAPHLVLAPLSIADCFLTMSWAVFLSHHLQTLAIVLSDQFMGQSLQIMDALPGSPFQLTFEEATLMTPYQRYQDTVTGVSVVAHPGDIGGMYTADGLEHSENGVPSPKASDHLQQLEKRQRKLQQFDFGAYWGNSRGEEGEWLLLCFGSLYGALLEARQSLVDQGINTKVIGLRLLQPFPRESFLASCGSTRQILVIEQNHQAQLFHYLNSLALPGLKFSSLAQPGPSMITPEQIVADVLQRMETSAQEIGDDSKG